MISGIWFVKLFVDFGILDLIALITWVSGYLSGFDICWWFRLILVGLTCFGGFRYFT